MRTLSHNGWKNQFKIAVLGTIFQWLLLLTGWILLKHLLIPNAIICITQSLWMVYCYDRVLFPKNNNSEIPIIKEYND